MIKRMKKQQNILFSDAQKIFKNKKMVYAVWRAESNDDSPYHNWRIILEKMFGKFISLDTSKNYFRYGKRFVNEKLLEIVEKEKPDYVFFSIVYDELDFSAIQAIKKISPNSILINLCGDDDWRFDEFSRYYAHLFDYSILMQDVRDKYKKDKLTNAVFWYWAFNCDFLRPLNLKKKYDVSFVGRTRDSHRAELLTYLIKNGINAHVWGDGWAKYPELKEHYHGFLDAEGLVRVFNETKINLCFNMGGYGAPQVKGRIWEISACKSFSLNEYCEGYHKFFKKGKEIVSFRFNDKTDMLEKVKYYLKHEKEREEIAQRAYKKTIIYHNQTKKVIEFFIKTLNKKPTTFIKELPLVKNKVLSLSIEEINNPVALKEKLKNADYIYFKNNDINYYSYHENIQAYSLEKTHMNVSCCDYYAHNPLLENYLLFKASRAFNELNLKSFANMVNIYQLMFKKNYFIKNFLKIKSFIENKSSGIFNKDDLAFVSLPLMEIPFLHFNKSYPVMYSSFQMKFIDKLYSLYFQKKIIFNFYPYVLFFKSLLGERFITSALYSTILDKSKIMKVKKGI